MRVLHVLTAADADGGYGGPLSVAVSQASAMRALGHDVEIVSTHGSGSPRRDIEGLTTFASRTLTAAFPFSSRFSPALLGEIRRRSPQLDLLHVHFARELIAVRAVRNAARGGVPVVAQPHGMFVPDERSLYKIVDALAALPAIRTARLHIALNEWERDQLVRAGLPAETIRIVPNAAPDLISPHYNSHPSHVVFISRLHPRKRVLAFAAMAELLLRVGEVPPGTRFTVFGPDAGDLPALIQFIEALPLHLREGVSYGGPLAHEDVTPTLAGAGVFVLPSRNEPFPIALLEAMSAGVPTVCTDTCHIAGLIHQYGAGAIVGERPEELASAVARILGDKTYARSLVNGAFQLIHDELSTTVIAGRLETVYREAIGQSAPG